ncbi:DMT family transporter [Fulvivirga sp. M361]|uniref:DMT family transporter n=1 Tax=Fulvivirga sp. M361 TaxID=2594266 RepID=UPI00117BCF87|nr:DMT family transporter [Fulvivirga sp. M361]TRX55963.1 DMT family transporter [Fulvivirga sp. M361]
MGVVRDYVKLHFIVLIWGFTAILGLLISIPSVELVFYRTLLATVILYFLMCYRQRNFRLGLSEILKMIGTGMLISAHWILFFASARVSTASVCLAGLATCSLWTSLLEPLMGKKKVKMLEVGLGMMVILGLYVIFRFEFDHALGLGMALVSAFLAALFSVINSRFTKRHNHYMITYYEMMGACLGTVMFFPFYSIYFTDRAGLQLVPTLTDWFYIGILSLICTVYAYSVWVELMKRFSAFVINLTVNLEPIYGIVLALLFFGEKEKMQSGFYIGTAVMLLSVLSYPAVDRYYKRKAMRIDPIR